MIRPLILSTKKAEKGMSLAELAISLGVMGLVLGTLWSVIGSVWKNHQEERAQRQILMVVQNIRDYYQNAESLGCSTNDDITDELDDNDRRLIPTEMRETPNDEGNDIYHALATKSGGSFKVTCLNNGREFRIELLDVPRENCIGFYMGFPVLVPEIGIKNVLHGSTIEAVNLLDIDDPATGYPMTLSTANGWCSNETNDIGFDFKLRN